MKATIKLKQEVLIRDNEIANNGYHQTIMNIMYNHWQKVNMSYEDILNWFEKEYGELARFAVQIGKFNQQVTNGGFLQYYNNGYCGDIEDVEYTLSLHNQLVVLMSKTELKDEISLKVLKILDELYIELDLEKYIEEEIYTDDGDVNYEEYDNDNYMEVVNTEMLNNFDNEYYKICDKFMVVLEQYFRDKNIGDLK